MGQPRLPALRGPGGPNAGGRLGGASPALTAAWPVLQVLWRCAEQAQPQLSHDSSTCLGTASFALAHSLVTLGQHRAV